MCVCVCVCVSVCVWVNVQEATNVFVVVLVCVLLGMSSCNRLGKSITRPCQGRRAGCVCLCVCLCVCVCVGECAEEATNVFVVVWCVCCLVVSSCNRLGKSITRKEGAESGGCVCLCVCQAMKQCICGVCGGTYVDGGEVCTHVSPRPF